MDPDRRRVDLVRVPREEQYYNVEDVLPRDTASVFPTESRKAALDTDAAKAILNKGNKRFISETELAEIKAVTGGKGRVEDGSHAADKPLVEVLREQREAKEAKFQEQWKQMKTGKNRPLDEDELEFLDSMAEAEAARRRREAAEEEAELDIFKALREEQEAKAKAEENSFGDREAGAFDGEAKQQPQQAGASFVGGAGKKGAGPGSGSSKVAVKPRIAAIVRPKRGGKDALEEPLKRQKVEDLPLAESKEEEGGLAGLLCGYCSGDDSD